MIEFLIVFPALFLLFLGVVQLALLAVADLAVRHAAIEGARAAVVVLDDDPQYYEGEARLRIADGRGADGPRMALIRSAVHSRLAAIAPDARVQAQLFDADRTTVAAALGAARSRAHAGHDDYLAIATAVVLARAPGAAAVQEIAPTEEPLVVRVTHLLPCAVPVAGVLLCRMLVWDSRNRRIANARGNRGAVAELALADLTRAPAAERQQVLARSALRFAPIQAEASLPLHAARYRYASERSAP